MAVALAVLLALALALAGCGSDTPELDAACLRSPHDVERALRRAPGPVALDSGTRLSECVAAARSDADLQEAGLVLTRAADDLAAAARAGSAVAALRLGYLVGATRRGARHTAGIHAELQRRIERSGAPLEDVPGLRAAVTRGLRAGEASG
jgi:integrase